MKKINVIYSILICVVFAYSNNWKDLSNISIGDTIDICNKSKSSNYSEYETVINVSCVILDTTSNGYLVQSILDSYEFRDFNSSTDLSSIRIGSYDYTEILFYKALYKEPINAEFDNMFRFIELKSDSSLQNTIIKKMLSIGKIKDKYIEEEIFNYVFKKFKRDFMSDLVNTFFCHSGKLPNRPTEKVKSEKDVDAKKKKYTAFSNIFYSHDTKYYSHFVLTSKVIGDSTDTTVYRPLKGEIEGEFYFDKKDGLPFVIKLDQDLDYESDYSPNGSNIVTTIISRRGDKTTFTDISSSKAFAIFNDLFNTPLTCLSFNSYKNPEDSIIKTILKKRNNKYEGKFYRNRDDNISISSMPVLSYDSTKGFIRVDDSLSGYFWKKSFFNTSKKGIPIYSSLSSKADFIKHIRRSETPLVIEELRSVILLNDTGLIVTPQCYDDTIAFFHNSIEMKERAKTLDIPTSIIEIVYRTKDIKSIYEKDIWLKFKNFSNKLQEQNSVLVVASPSDITDHLEHMLPKQNSLYQGTNLRDLILLYRAKMESEGAESWTDMLFAPESKTFRVKVGIKEISDNEITKLLTNIAKFWKES